MDQRSDRKDQTFFFNGLQKSLISKYVEKNKNNDMLHGPIVGVMLMLHASGLYSRQILKMEFQIFLVNFAGVFVIDSSRPSTNTNICKSYVLCTQ